MLYKKYVWACAWRWEHNYISSNFINDNIFWFYKTIWYMPDTTIAGLCTDAIYSIIAIYNTVSKSLNPTPHVSPPRSVGNALCLKSKGRWFEPAVIHYFSSNNVRLLAHVFSCEDLQSEWLKRDKSNRVYWFQTRFLFQFICRLFLS